MSGSLFKFRNWGNPKHQSILRQQLIWFANPSSFNDPFDCMIPPRYDFLSKEECNNLYIHLTRELNPGRDIASIIAEADEKTSNAPFRNSESLESDIKNFLDKRNKSYGLFSACKANSNLLLWAHYADAHRGFSVELDAEKMDDMFNSLFHTDGHLIKGFPVIYVSEYPILKPHPTNEDHDYWDILLHTKSKYWEYEQEYRYIYADRSDLARKLDPGIISAIYLGCRMPQEHKDEILDVIKINLPHVIVYQAKPKLDKFELDFLPIEV